MVKVLKNVWCLTEDYLGAKNVDVIIADDIISEILPSSKTLKINAAEIYDGAEKTALLPGFVNAHAHTAMILLRGLAEEKKLKEWLEEDIFPAENKLTAEMIYWGAAAGILEMAANGITCFADMYYHMDSVAKAAEEIGMRCCLSRGLIGNDDKRLFENLELANKYNTSDLINVQLGPHAPYTVDMDFMCKVAAVSVEKKIGIHLHFLETNEERQFLLNAYKMLPLEYLHKTGLLNCPALTLAHGVAFFPEEIEELAKYFNVTIAHNPSSNLKLGSGVAPVSSMLMSGVNVALGTDSAASNNRLDMLMEMRTAALLHKGITHDPTVLPAHEVLKMATINGAKALGFDKVGKVEQGWQADLVLVDLSKPHYIGVTPKNLPTFLVYSGLSGDVVATMVRGKWIYKQGALSVHNHSEIFHQAKLCRKKIDKTLM